MQSGYYTIQVDEPFREVFGEFIIETFQRTRRSNDEQIRGVPCDYETMKKMWTKRKRTQAAAAAEENQCTHPCVIVLGALPENMVQLWCETCHTRFAELLQSAQAAKKTKISPVD